MSHPLRPRPEPGAPLAPVSGLSVAPALAAEPVVPRPVSDEGFATVWLDRLHAWRDDPRARVAAIAVFALACGFVWYRVAVGGGGQATPVAPTADAASNEAAALAGPAAPEGGPIVVHVAGAVAAPGVYELPAGARVAEAIEAAGGAAPDADLDRLNLAARLADGQRVHVARVGAPNDAGGSAAATDDGSLVNLNTATPAELESLPGIGPVLAQAIIEAREARGGFRSIRDLLAVRGIGEGRFADVRAHVTV